VGKQRLVESAAAVAEQRAGGALDRAVGVDLDERPLGRPSMWIAWSIQLLTRAAVGGSSPVIAPFSIRIRASCHRAAGERERPGDHQHAVVVVCADARPFAVLVRAALCEVADRPVDLVDLVGLTRIRGRREREVDVAAELVEHDQLVVDAAPLPIGPAVGEAPLPWMNAQRKPLASREMWPCCENVRRCSVIRGASV